MQPIYVSKQLVTASSTLIGVLSTAVVPVYTANAGTPMPLDTGRRVIIWSSNGDLSSLLVTVTGTQESGGTLIEQLVCSSATGLTRATTGDFLTVTSVSASSRPEGPVNVGTNTQGGTPWKQVSNMANPFSLGAAIVFSSTANSMLVNFEYTMDDITGIYPRPLTTLSTATTPIVFKPNVFISLTAVLSTASANVASFVTAPMAAWRMTLTSSSSTAGLVMGTVVQDGV